jgi:hypothetical protein
MNSKGFRRRCRCLIEVPSQHLPEVTRENQENLNLDSNRISPENKPGALPLHQPAPHDDYDVYDNDTSNTTTTTTTTTTNNNNNNNNDIGVSASTHHTFSCWRRTGALAIQFHPFSSLCTI